MISTPSYTILKDPDLNAQLVRDGFIVIPILDEAEISFFKALYKKWHPQDPPAFYKSYFSENNTYKIEVEQAILNVFVPKLKAYFTDFDAFGAMFVIKPPGEQGHIPPHQDWSLVDERLHWSLNSWCPLIDTTGENGNIQMLRGSHRFLDSIRGSGTPELYSHLYEQIPPYLENVPLKAGEAVFFFHSIVHCSTYNAQQDARVTLGLSMKPQHAPLIYHYLKPGDQYPQKFRVTPEFLLNYVSQRSEIPEGCEPLGIDRNNFKRLTESEFKACIVAIENEAHAR